MPKDQSFHDYIVYDLLGDMPRIKSRAMFSGWALYKDKTVFGIIAEGELYFKVGKENRAVFEKMRSHPFTYERKGGKSITMSYWLVTEEALEDKERLYDLVDQSVAIRRKM